MKFKVLALIVAMIVGTGAVSASASSERMGDLHVTKECSQYIGNPGDFCSITSSNLPAIKVGSKVFYDQPPGIPTGMLDSNVVLDAGNGNRAVGRCTLDLTTNRGLCTFSDGTGNFAGFHARINVVCTAPQGTPCRWDGQYRFESEGR
jgi:hypothetical protein